MRPIKSVIAVICGGLAMCAALFAAQAAAATLPGRDAKGSPQACEAYAYSAIKAHKLITATPAACQGLSGAQLNQAASTAIRMTLTRGTKSALRRQTGAAAVWVRALISYIPPTPESSVSRLGGQLPASGPAGRPGLGGVSELAAKIGALLAWLATAASGGWVLARWLLAGGSPRRGTATAAPPAVIVGHVGAGVLGLVLWAFFLLSGWVALAWTALGMLAPVSGLGMGMLVLGLPAPVRPPFGTRRAGRRARIPVFAIAAHGLFAVTALLLVLTATVGAG